MHPAINQWSLKSIIHEHFKEINYGGNFFGLFFFNKRDFQKFPGSDSTIPFTFKIRYKTIYIYLNMDQFLVLILFDRPAVLGIVDPSLPPGNTSSLGCYSPGFSPSSLATFTQLSSLVPSYLLNL